MSSVSNNNITTFNTSTILKQPEKMQEGLPASVTSALKKPKLPVIQRLEKNRKYAQQQQENGVIEGFEMSKGFKIMVAPIPNDIEGCPIEINKEKVNQTWIGKASCKGYRDRMEDRDLVTKFEFIVKGQVHEAEVFGVFDGHAGTFAADFVKSCLVQYLRSALEENNQVVLSNEGIFAALKTCFTKLGNDYEGMDGTTAISAIILNNSIWIANVGDSRAIFAKEGIAEQVSEDAKPFIARYKKDIIDKGGFVEFGRVNGKLAVARAIGDKGTIGKLNEHCISSHPKLIKVPLDEYRGHYLVLASDGLWDVASSNEVGTGIEQMTKTGLKPEEMAKILVYHAISIYKSKDNVTCLVIKIPA